MTVAPLLAFGAGAAAVLGAWEALAAVERSRVIGALGRALEPVVRAGREGRFRRSPSAAASRCWRPGASRARAGCWPAHSPPSGRRWARRSRSSALAGAPAALRGGAVAGAPPAPRGRSPTG